MKLLLVLCLFVACVSAWRYTRPKFEYDFAIPSNAIWKLNPKQDSLHAHLVGYDADVGSHYYGCEPCFMGTHITCTATDFVGRAGVPFEDATLVVNSTQTPSDEFVLEIDEYVTLKFASPRPYTTFERALFGRQLGALRDTYLSFVATSWSCAVDIPDDDYEGFSVGYTTANKPRPDITLVRALTFAQAKEFGVTQNQYDAAIRATFEDSFPRELNNVLSIVHSCHTFTYQELSGQTPIPDIDPSDEISRQVCWKIRLNMKVVCRNNGITVECVEE